MFFADTVLLFFTPIQLKLLFRYLLSTNFTYWIIISIFQLNNAVLQPEITSYQPFHVNLTKNI